jgi:hypothetical protein
VSNQPLFTHGAEKAQGAGAAAVAPGPYLAPDEDKKGNTNNERRCPKDDAHVGEDDAHVDESKYRKICFSSIRRKLFVILHLANWRFAQLAMNRCEPGNKQEG